MEDILKSYKLLIDGDIHYTVNSFAKTVLKTAIQYVAVQISQH